jgi:hypothetical protein
MEQSIIPSGDYNSNITLGSDSNHWSQINTNYLRSTGISRGMTFSITPSGLGADFYFCAVSGIVTYPLLNITTNVGGGEDNEWAVTTESRLISNSRFKAKQGVYYPTIYILSTSTTGYTLDSGGSSYTLDHYVFANHPVGSSITLPSAVSTGSYTNLGRKVTVKNINTGTCTVDSAAGTIDGSATDTLAQYESQDYISDGTNWYKV